MRDKSGFTITFDQRYKIKQIKKALVEKLGRSITDVELMQILLDTFEEHQHKSLVAEAQKLIELANELILREEMIKDYEKLKEENEELRKQVEELKEKLNKVDLTQYSAKELFYAFVRRLSDELEQQGFRNEEIDQIMKTITHIAVTVFPMRSDKPNYKALANLVFVR